MSNYNFLNLDSNEFEQVCAEILSIYLNKSFRTFAQGPDGGIDIKQTDGSAEIIGQAKRYKNPGEIRIGEEYDKIIRIPDCKKYYFFTSCPLSPKKITEIFTTFKSYMEDESFVFDAIALNNLLEKDEYMPVLRKHFRLWATSEKILNLLMSNDIQIDTNVFKDNIKNHLKYYVETEEYLKALAIFEKEKIILLKGSAGIGKTTTSEMLVLNFLNKYQNARFIYSSSGNIETLKKSLSNNPETVELVLIDDFLGDIYLNLKGDKINSIVSFISYFKNSKNKHLIINSRIVILKEALNNYAGLEKSLEDIGIKQIDLSGLSKRDRAKILYNHIYFSGISFEDKELFLKKKMYITITEHPHYNPRLIEDICNSKRFALSGLTFEQYVTDTLENQERTWHHAFENNLDKADRLMLHVLYSFDDQYLRIASLEKAFLFEAQRAGGIDLSKDVFGSSLKRLSGAFLKISVITGGSRFVGFLNPSIKDYISSRKYFDGNSEFLFFDQYLAVNGADAFLTSGKFNQMIRNNVVGTLLLESFRRNDPYILYFARNLVLDKQLEEYYLRSISEDMHLYHGKISNYYIGDLFKHLVAKQYINFYDISLLDGDELEMFVTNCISNLEVKDIIKVFEKVNQKSLREVLSTDKIRGLIIDTVYTDYDKSYAIEVATYRDDYDGHPILDEYKAKEYAVEEIDTEINQEFHELFERFDFSIDENDIDDYIDSYDFRREYESQSRDYDSDDYYVGESSNGNCYDIFNNLLR